MNSIQNDIDPIMPFSVEFDKRSLPSSLGLAVNPVIYFGSQAKGFFGNIRYAKARSTRIFFFEISLSEAETNFPSYYTIIVVIPGGFTKDPSMPNYQKVFQTIEICKKFQKINKNFTGECIQEANRFANLAVQHVNSQNPTPGTWGSEVGSDELVMMAIVVGQFDFGFEPEMLSAFSVGKIDFNPPKAAAKSASKVSSRKGGKKRRSIKRRISKKRKSNRRKGSKKRY